MSRGITNPDSHALAPDWGVALIGPELTEVCDQPVDPALRLAITGTVRAFNGYRFKLQSGDLPPSEQTFTPVQYEVPDETAPACAAYAAGKAVAEAYGDVSSMVIDANAAFGSNNAQDYASFRVDGLLLTGSANFAILAEPVGRVPVEHGRRGARRQRILDQLSDLRVPTLSLRYSTKSAAHRGGMAMLRSLKPKDDLTVMRGFTTLEFDGLVDTEELAAAMKQAR